MTQEEAAKKYRIPLYTVCALVKKYDLEPIGTTMGKVKQLKDFDEREIVEAIITDYKEHYDHMIDLANEWKNRAAITKEILRTGKSEKVFKDIRKI